MKENKGITLIALVITIIVLIILAGISIAMLTGENGILTKASQSKGETRFGAIKEEVNLWKQEQILDNNLKQNDAEGLDSFVNRLLSEGMLTQDEAAEVLNEGKITIDEKTIIFIEKEKILINASKVKNNAQDFYGKEVKGYICPSEGVDKWRIFYADDSNIYLISDSYLKRTYAPKSPNGYSVNKNSGEYSTYFFDITNDKAYSKGNLSIKETSKATKWLSDFLALGDNINGYNVKGTAYLMDTNVWSVFAGDKAEYAIGGPTIQLYCASYKDIYPDKYLENEVNSTGYKVKYSTDSSFSTRLFPIKTENKDNGIYVKNVSETQGMWFASPCGDGDDVHIMRIALDYSIDSGAINGGTLTALRPIVCLSHDVALRELEDGTYNIQ